MALIPALIQTALAYKREKERQMERAYAQSQADQRQSDAGGYEYRPIDISPIIEGYKQKMRANRPEPYSPSPMKKPKQ